MQDFHTHSQICKPGSTATKWQLLNICSTVSAILNWDYDISSSKWSATYIWCVSKLGDIFKILFPIFELSPLAATIWIFLWMDKHWFCCGNYVLSTLEKMLNWSVLLITHPFLRVFGPIFSEKGKIDQLHTLFWKLIIWNICNWLPSLKQAWSAISGTPQLFVSANL